MASLRVFGGRFLGRSIEISLTKSKEGLVLGCQSPLTPVTQVIARPPKHLRVIGLPLRIGFSRATIQSPYVCSRATSQSNRSEADKAFDKHTPNILDAFEGQTIKAGQVVCYVEQLGSQTPVESKVAGEVIRVLKTNGEAVGYGDPLISILPSFPGIKKLI